MELLFCRIYNNLIICLECTSMYTKHLVSRMEAYLTHLSKNRFQNTWKEVLTEPIIRFTWREKFSFFWNWKTIYATTTILHVNSVCCKRIFLLILEKIKNAQYFNNLIQWEHRSHHFISILPLRSKTVGKHIP